MKIANKTNTVINVLKNHLSHSLPFFDDLTTTQKNSLIENCSLCIYGDCETVHSFWNSNYGYYLVCKGKLQAYTMSAQGKEFGLFAVSPKENENQSFCEAILIYEGDNKIDFRTTCSCEIAYIPMDTWRELTNQSIQVNQYSLNITRQLVDVILHSMQSFLFLSVEQKVALHLTEKLSQMHDTHPNVQIVNETHEHIAVILGNSRESVSRTLNKFKKNGIIKTFHGKIEIVDEAALYEILNH